jgi:hypothetical protein
MDKRHGQWRRMDGGARNSGAGRLHHDDDALSIDDESRNIRAWIWERVSPENRSART